MNRYGLKTVFLALILLGSTAILPCSEICLRGPGSISTAEAAEIGVNVGNQAPEFQLPDLSGQWIAVNYTTTRATVLNFWATWCPPCRGEMPELNSFAAQHGGEVAFYAVNLRETPDTVGKFFSNQGLSMPVLLDRDGSLGRKFQVNLIPTTLIMDGQGMIVFRKSGQVTQTELEGVIANLL